MADWLKNMNRKMGGGGGGKRGDDGSLAKALAGADKEITRSCALATFWPAGKASFINVIDRIHDEVQKANVRFALAAKVYADTPDSEKSEQELADQKTEMELALRDLLLKIGCSTIFRYMGSKVGNAFGMGYTGESKLSGEEQKRMMSKMMKSMFDDLGLRGMNFDDFDLT